MNWQDVFNRFVFDDNAIFYYHVNPVTNLDVYIFIYNRNRNLAFYIQSSFYQFIDQALLISGLEQSRSKCTVNFNRCINDDTGNIFTFFAFTINFAFFAPFAFQSFNSP